MQTQGVLADEGGLPVPRKNAKRTLDLSSAIEEQRTPSSFSSKPAHSLSLSSRQANSLSFISKQGHPPSFNSERAISPIVNAVRGNAPSISSRFSSLSVSRKTEYTPSLSSKQGNLVSVKSEEFSYLPPSSKLTAVASVHSKRTETECRESDQHYSSPIKGKRKQRKAVPPVKNKKKVSPKQKTASAARGKGETKKRSNPSTPDVSSPPIKGSIPQSLNQIQSS